MGPQNSRKGVKKLLIVVKAAMKAYRKAGTKTQEIIPHTGRNVMTITRILAASRALADHTVHTFLAGPGKLPAMSSRDSRCGSPYIRT